MFLDMFIEALFTSKGGTKINNDFVHKYVFVLAYAASVIEHYDDTVSLINCSSINLLLHNTFRHLRFFLILLYVDCGRLNSSFMKSQNCFTGWKSWNKYRRTAIDHRSNWTCTTNSCWRKGNGTIVRN